MSNCVGFEAIARTDARVLILGTLPSVESLKKKQYYAWSQNSFWKIMGELVGASPDLPYETRLTRLREHGIAVWDVCAVAEREGSLDSAIRSPTPNDFVSFFTTHRSIKLICFNGQSAQNLFRRYVAPHMPEDISALPCRTLPSTSSAHAGLRYEQKLSLWRAALTASLAPPPLKVKG